MRKAGTYLIRISAQNRTMSSDLTLYPHLAASVLFDYLAPCDQDLLIRLAARNREIYDKPPSKLQLLLSPSVSQSGQRFEITPIGSVYSEPVQRQILNNWRLAGGSPILLAIISSAQRQLVTRLIFEPNGMFPERRPPAKIGKIGKESLKPKDVQNLLHSLKFSYQYDWPIEQLANIIRPYAKKTRRKKTR